MVPSTSSRSLRPGSLRAEHWTCQVLQMTLPFSCHFLLVSSLLFFLFFQKSHFTIFTLFYFLNLSLKSGTFSCYFLIFLFYFSIRTLRQALKLPVSRWGSSGACGTRQRPLIVTPIAGSPGIKAVSIRKLVDEAVQLGSGRYFSLHLEFLTSAYLFSGEQHPTHANLPNQRLLPHFWHCPTARRQALQTILGNEPLSLLPNWQQMANIALTNFSIA